MCPNDNRGGALMGALGRARDAVWDAPDEARDEALDAYAQTVRDYLLADLEGELESVRRQVDSDAARVTVAWALDILARHREG